MQRQPHLAELLHQRAVLVDVNFDEFQPAAGGAGNFLENRGEGFAGATPGRPEIDDHRDAARSLDDIRHEGALIAIEDHGGRIRLGICGIGGIAE